MGTDDIWLNVAIWGTIWVVVALFATPGPVLLSFCIGLFVLSLGVGPGVAMALRVTAILSLPAAVYLIIRSRRLRRGPGLEEPEPKRPPKLADMLVKMVSKLKGRNSRKIDLV